MSDKNKKVSEKRKEEICEKQTVYDLTDKYCKDVLMHRLISRVILLKYWLVIDMFGFNNNKKWIIFVVELHKHN